MIFLTGHGSPAQPEPAKTKSPYAPTISAAAACGYAPEAYPDMATAPLGRFDFLFPDAPVVPHTASTTAELDALGATMVDQATMAVDNSHIPAIFTYIGQFIDHDITAGTDRETDFSRIDQPNVTPAPRTEVAQTVANLRTGALDLDSLYGGAALEGPFSEVFRRALRFPPDPAKLMLGTADGPTSDIVSKPSDPARDLFRLGWALDRSPPSLTTGDLASAPQELQDLFFDADGNVLRSRAVIGDERNDENLAVAQFHMTMARFHNVMVDSAPPGTAEERFDWARRQVRWTYQWLIVNDYLPRVCDPAVVADTRTQEAPVYRAFFDRVRAAGEWSSAYGGKLPLPLEFSVAAFRFGHTMARPDYDWNAVFGRAVPGKPHFRDRADFVQLFEFTGNARPQLGQTDPGGNPVMAPSRLDASGNRLPKIWVIDMARMFNAAPDGPLDDRNTRRIDTRLAPPLLDMAINAPGMTGILRHLAKRNLRRGHRLNLPSAQGCINGLAGHGIAIAALNASELQSGETGSAVTEEFKTHTPLWFYILKEAELLAEGHHLGPLGSRLVAETLIGLAIHTPDSYWAQPGTDNGRWHPRDGARPNGVSVESFLDLARAAGMV